MKIRLQPVFQTTAFAVALLAPIGATQGGDPVTIPSAARNIEGNSDNLYPFNGNPMRYQQVIAANEFPAGPTRITKIALRADAVGGTEFSETLGNVRINLSTSQKIPATLSRTFADNLGADDTIVFDGELSLTSAFADAGDGSKSFDIIITLTTPFTYDPAAGSLLLDVRNFSGGNTTQLDAHDAPDSTARVWSDDIDSATAIAGDLYPSVGLVIRFLTD